MDEEVKIILDYISVWGWQLIATLFLVASLLAVAMPSDIVTMVFFIIFFACFLFFEFVALKRKNDFYKE